MINKLVYRESSYHERKEKGFIFLSLSFIGWFIIPILLIIAGGVSLGFGFNGSSGDPFSLILLGFVCLIVGMIAAFGVSIYVIPYFMTTMAAFYDDYAKPKQIDIIQDSEPLEPIE